MPEPTAITGSPRPDDLSPEEMKRDLFIHFRKNLQDMSATLMLAALVAPEEMLTFLDELNNVSAQVKESCDIGLQIRAKSEAES